MRNLILALAIMVSFTQCEKKSPEPKGDPKVVLTSRSFGIDTAVVKVNGNIISLQPDISKYKFNPGDVITVWGISNMEVPKNNRVFVFTHYGNTVPYKYINVTDSIINDSFVIE